MAPTVPINHYPGLAPENSEHPKGPPPSTNGTTLQVLFHYSKLEASEANRLL